MAPSKKRQQPGNDSPAVKKPRTEARPAPAFTSALQSEEVDFPRGGGTSLTALEVKQTRAEGARQADAEMGKTLKKKKLSTRQMQKAKKEKATAESDAAKAERDKDTIRVEELSYKRLVPGTLVLARVHTVLPLHLVVSMPNNLLGHIPITEVSNTLTAALNADIDAMSEDEDEEDEEKEGAPELTDIFRPGQYIPTRVINTFPTASQAFIAQYPVSETTRLAARVELTAVPEKINLDVAKQDVEKGYRIVGEVLGAEDKGYRVGLGLSADTGLAGVEGFIPIEEVEKNAGGELLHPSHWLTLRSSYSRTAHPYRRFRGQGWRPRCQAYARPANSHSQQPDRGLEHRLASPRPARFVSRYCRRPLWSQRQDLRFLRWNHRHCASRSR